MQKSESRAWMPRQVARSIAQGVCDAHNTRKRKIHPKANPDTGIVGDKTGLFVTEVKRPRKINFPER